MKITLNKAQYDYLKENNILEQYKTNIKKYNIRNEDYDFSDKRTFIAHSFQWNLTKEGFRFWIEHNRKYLELTNKDLYTLEL